MSQQTPDKTHLWEDDLTESADKERKSLAEWATSVSFKQQAEDFEIYDSDDLSTRVEPFLRELGLLGKGFSLVQIPGPKSSSFRHGAGDAYIIPVQLLDGTPTVSGKPLQEGKIIYMKAKREVRIEAKVRLLFVLL